MIEKILLFDKQNGSYIAEVFKEDRDNFDLNLFKYKEITYNPDTHVWRGSYLTGKLVSKEEMAKTIYEIGLNQQCRKCIINEYPTDDQINNITKALLEVISQLKVNGPSINKLVEQYNFIEECKQTNKRYINAYKNSPDWTLISEDDELSFMRENTANINSEDLGVHSIDL